MDEDKMDYRDMLWQERQEDRRKIPDWTSELLREGRRIGVYGDKAFFHPRLAKEYKLTPGPLGLIGDPIFSAYGRESQVDVRGGRKPTKASMNMVQNYLINPEGDLREVGSYPMDKPGDPQPVWPVTNPDYADYKLVWVMRN